MLFYDAARLYHIDFTDSQLPEEEIVLRIDQMSRQAEQEKGKEAARWTKARSFHFSGGML